MSTLRLEHAQAVEGLSPPSARHCVGCPASCRDMLPEMIADSTFNCAFDTRVLEGRESLPVDWLDRYRFALVRRGYLVRQRTDSRGRVTAVDAVGPGCGFAIPTVKDESSGPAGYALGRALVCLVGDGMEETLYNGGKSSRDLIQLHAETQDRVERLSDARARTGAKGKVAALLCALADTLRPGSTPSDRVPGEFLQRDLAALLSIRHESVCRALRELERDGLVTRDSDWVTLTDRPALEAM